jgi:methionine biosynthesis protein MetW
VLRYDWCDMRRDEVGGAVCALVPVRSRVLDVGCGTGALAAAVRVSRGAEVVGVEPEPTRAAAARSKGLSVEVGVLTATLLEQLGRFDVVLIADVLEHLVNPGSMLQLVRTALRPDGMMVVSVPNVAHWTVRVDLLRGRFRYSHWGIMDAEHLRWFTRQSLNDLLARCGFTPEACIPTAGVMLDAYAERPPWKWLPRSVCEPAVRLLVRLFPELFACQFVVAARSNQTDVATAVVERSDASSRA